MSEESGVMTAGAAGTIEVPPAPPKPSKLDEKRRKIYVDRMQRHMAKGLTQEQAHMKIMEEDYDRLPIETKLKRLEGACMQAIQRLAGELGSLQHNDQVIADAMDANFRAISKSLAKLGITGEEQVAFLKEAEAEIIADRENRKKVMEAHQAAVQEEATKVQVEKTIDTPGEAPVPDGATVFT